MAPTHFNNSPDVGPTAKATEDFAAAVYNYYSALRKTTYTIRQIDGLKKKLNQAMHQLLFCVLIDYGHASLIRYAKETQSLLDNRRRKAEEQ